MAKIPIILEAGRADGKLATSDSIFDENKGMFQSELNDIQDTLNSDNPNKPLSAKQGKVLKELLDTKVIEVGAVPIDDEPIEGNITHVVNSNGLAKEFNKCNTEIILGGVYDVSTHNNGAVFASISALLSDANLSTLIPISVRHGGMSIRFIQSSDNKYVQYFLPKNKWSIDPNDWEKMNLEGEVSQLSQKVNGIINEYTASVMAGRRAHIYAPLNGMATVKLERVSGLTETTWSLYIAPTEGTQGQIIASNVSLGESVDCNIPAGNYGIDIMTTTNTSLEGDRDVYKATITSFGIEKDVQTLKTQTQELKNSVGESVKFVEQSLTEEEKEQARTNIEALSFNDVSLFRFGYTEFTNKLIKEIYISPTSIYYGWNDLYVKMTRKAYDETFYGIGFSPDDSTTTYFWAKSKDDELSIVGNELLGVWAIVDWSVALRAHQTYSGQRLDIDKAKCLNFSPQIANLITEEPTIAAMNANTNTNFAHLLYTVGRTGMVSLIDDDGVFDERDGKNIQTILLPIARSLGINFTFAIICGEEMPLTKQVTLVDGSTTTKKEFMAQLQKEGHHFTAHPNHKGWYGDHYDITKVEPSLIDCLVELQNASMLHSDMLIYPGTAHTNPQVIEIVRKWCVCGITSGYSNANHLGDNTNWKIRRLFIDFEDIYNKHSQEEGFVSAMDWYKDKVDEAATNGDWLIFGTHCFQFTTSDDTTNPNANTKGNLSSLLQYAINSGLEFRTAWDAYNRRRYLFEFNEINKSESV